MKYFKICIVLLITGLFFSSCKNTQFSQQKYAYLEKIPVNEKAQMPEKWTNAVNDNINEIENKESNNKVVQKNPVNIEKNDVIDVNSFILADKNEIQPNRTNNFDVKTAISKTKSLINSASLQSEAPRKLTLKGKIKQFQQLQQLKKALKSNSNLSTTDVLLIVLIVLIGLLLLIIFKDLIILLLLVVLLLLLILLLMNLV